MKPSPPSKAQAKPVALKAAAPPAAAEHGPLPLPLPLPLQQLQLQQQEQEQLTALFSQGRFAELEVQVSALLKDHPENGFLWKGLGIALSIQGKDGLQALQNAALYSPQDAEAHSSLGNGLMQCGRLEEAVKSYRRAVEIKPDFAEAHHSLGKALLNLGRLEEAISSYQRLLSLRPGLAEAHSSMGKALKSLGRLDEAVASYRLALQLKPDDFVSLNNMGNALLALERPQEALESFQAALGFQPDFAEAHGNMGNALMGLDRTQEALDSYQRALEFNPDFADAHSNRGHALRTLGRLEESVISCKQALQHKPDSAQAHNNLGNALKDLGRPEDALASYRQAIAIQPDYAAAHINLGAAFRDLGRFSEAIKSCRRAIEIQPTYAMAYNNLGASLKDLGRLEEATTSYRRAIEIQPDYAKAHNNLGIALMDLGHLDLALASCRQALALEPDLAIAHNTLLFSSNYLPEHPREQALADARRYGEVVAAKAKPYTRWASWPNLPDPARPLRVGFVSGDLREHPVAHFLQGLVKALADGARGRLELLAYSNHVSSDANTAALKACFDSWCFAVGLSDAQLAERIRSDGVDILIDLSGHTAHNRLPVFAFKPAPVQVSWLGYFATTGVQAIDYLLADPLTLPPALERDFTEQIWRLPQTRLCFTPPQSAPDVAALPALRQGHITFGCFNNLSKMNEAVVALWAQILMAVPGSRLFLKCKQLGEASLRDSVTERFASHGIEAARLTLEGQSPRKDYLAAYARVDIALDPFPFAGGTTTAEGLWMGVPALTLAGERFISRQGLGLMLNAGLPEWVAGSTEDYLARACTLASDLPALAALRAGLRAKVLASPVFDSAAFAQHFEAALRAMWQRWCLTQDGDGSGAASSSAALQAAPSTTASTSSAAQASTKPLPQQQQAQLTALFGQGRFAELEVQVSALLKDHPENGFLWKGLGIALSIQGKEGLQALQNAALYSPQDAEAHSSLGNGLMRLGRLEDAAACYRRAVEIKPDFAEAHSSLGKALMSLGQLDEVVANFKQVLKILPDFAEAHSNLAVALGGLGRLEETVASCRRALAIKPDYAEAHNNLGLALWGLGRPEDAIASCRSALAIKPDFLDAHDNLLLCSNYLTGHPREQALADARRYGEVVAAKAKPHTRWASWPNLPDPTRPLRVGFVSGDLREHPVAHFLQGLVKALAEGARGRLELLAYSNHVSSDANTAALKACFDSWCFAVGLSDAQLAERIRSDGVDILIDLSGHTAHNRLPVFAFKPAPVQLSWLGYFATTGVQAIDYLLADPLTLPPALERDFTEQIWRLPQTRLCFTPPQSAPDVAALPALRQGHITFGCFNNLSKMNEAVVALWAQILMAVPGSRLFLKCKQLGEASMRDSVTERFASHGIEAARLTLEGQSPRKDYLAAYARVDIALDPFPFTGGTTTAEGLWMGVPALTLAGERFISRQGLGLMLNAGLPEWVAGSTEDYLARACTLASDLPALAALRAGLRAKVLASPVFDSAAFAQHFEAALRAIWQKWCLGRKLVGDKIQPAAV